MKKLACLVLSVTLLTGLAFPAYAAEQSSEAYRLYQNAMNKLEGKSLEMTGATHLSLLSGGETYTVKINFTAKQLVSSKGEQEAAIKMKVTMPDDGPAVIEQYVKDGWVYTRISDEHGEMKYRSRVDDTALTGLTPQGIAAGTIPFYTMASFNPNHSRDFFKDALVEDIEGGKKTRAKMSGSEIRKYILDALTRPYTYDSTGLTQEEIDMLNEYADLLDESNESISESINEVLQYFRFGNLVVTMKTDSGGALKTYQTNFQMAIVDDDEQIELKYASILRIDSVGRLQKIDFPSDLASYKAA